MRSGPPERSIKGRGRISDDAERLSTKTDEVGKSLQRTEGVRLFEKGYSDGHRSIWPTQNGAGSCKKANRAVLRERSAGFFAFGSA
jgi:hypothetical protein